MKRDFPRRLTTAKRTAALVVALVAVGSLAEAQTPPSYPAQTYPAQTYPNQTQPGYPSQPAQSYPPQSQQPPSGYPPAGAYPSQPSPGYPPQGSQGSPNQAMQGYPQQPAPPPPPPGPIKSFFISTLSAVASFTGPGVARVIGEALVGGIANWFSHGRQQQPSGAYGNAYASSGSDNAGYGSNAAYGTSTYGGSGYGTTAGSYGSAQGAYPQSGYPQSSYPQSGYPQSSYPQTASQGAYPQAAYPTATPGYGYGTAGAAGYPQTASTGSYGPATGTYGAAAAYPPSGGASGFRDAPNAGPDGAGGSSGVFAGVAYEVHLVDPAGRATPVDPNTYSFRSGDRFVVLYRPSLPGLMEVFNINAAGNQTKIDSARMAAGQLSTLGPYQFSGAAADESLVILLTPCSTPELVTATRDIINVSAAGSSAGQPAPGLRLAACGTTTRGLQTRDIQKVGVDGTTTYALDPVSAPELANGQSITRRVTINFRHR